MLCLFRVELNKHLVQVRQWEQHIHALPMHNQQVQAARQLAVGDRRAATIPASKVRCLFAFVKHIVVAAGSMF